MSRVKSVTYSIVVNGKQCGGIVLSRRLRHGDPLSPYLFLLCAEGLSSLLKSTVHEGSIQGVVASRNDPRISHLFFKNDSLLFYRARSSDCHKVLEILQNYEKASGQVINIGKSGIMLSANTSCLDKNTSMNILNVHGSMIRDNYLELPLLLGRSKEKEFRAIKERIWSCI